MAQGGSVANDEKAFASAVEKYRRARADVLKFAAPRPHSTPEHEVGCSFCLSPKSEVRDSVLGLNVSICDRCVLVAFEALKERGSIE
jgi:hypothetical protein